MLCLIISGFKNILKFVRTIHRFHIKLENRFKELLQPKIRFLKLKVFFIILTTLPS